MENNKAVFSTREWWMVLFIVSLVQAGIWFVAFVYAKSASALNYVSFAGTLISIILAVLAIGYSYGESVADKSKKDNIVNQIAQLDQAIKNIVIESSKLDKISEIHDGLVGLSANLNLHMTKTQEEVNGIKVLFKNTFEAAPQAVQGKIDEINEDLADTLFPTKNIFFKSTCMLLYYFQCSNIPIQSCEPTIRGIFTESLFRSEAQTVVALIAGSISSTALILSDFGIIKSTEGCITFGSKMETVVKAWANEMPTEGNGIKINTITKVADLARSLLKPFL